MSLPSPSPVYCQICNIAIRPSTYRLRLIDSHSSSSSSASSVATMYHVHCFETTFDLEQPGAFGRIYPAPSSSASSGNTHPGRLDDDARALVNAWKLQRRREGLESAAGPDSGIRITSGESCSCSLGGQENVFVSTSKKAGEKRSNRVMEAEAEERKRAKYYTSDDGYGPRGPNSLLQRATEVPFSLGNVRPQHSIRSHSDMGPGRSCRCSCQSASNHMGRGAEGSLDLSHLPRKLSDALQCLKAPSRTQ